MGPQKVIHFVLVQLTQRGKQEYPMIIKAFVSMLEH
jgi:hypothetical protein